MPVHHHASLTTESHQPQTCPAGHSYPVPRKSKKGSFFPGKSPFFPRVTLLSFAAGTPCPDPSCGVAMRCPLQRDAGCGSLDGDREVSALEAAVALPEPVPEPSPQLEPQLAAGGSAGAGGGAALDAPRAGSEVSVLLLPAPQ